MSIPTAPPAISQLLYLLDEAFESTSNDHSLVGNLCSLVPEDWRWVPAGGRRSIRDIVQHVGCSHITCILFLGALTPFDPI
jgi:hypothetical protein